MEKNANLSEENILDYKFSKMMIRYRLYDSNQDNINLIIKAYDLAKKLHRGVFRKSGEAYMFHPLTVASYAIDYNLDVVTVCASLLHDVLEDTDFTYEEMVSDFGKDIADTVDCVSKMTNEDYVDARMDGHIATVCKLFRYLYIQDIRGPVIKLLDRTHNMRTMDAMPPLKQVKKSEETLEVYAPMAQGIGANGIKKELHDNALKYTVPYMHLEISKILEHLYEQYQKEINEVKVGLFEALKSGHILENRAAIDDIIKLRIKNIYSVYISLKKGRDYDTIHDLYAFQITIPNIEKCFQAINLVHQKYPYLDDKFKDYINTPKTTGYRALHTTIISSSGRTYQIQIRTKEMGLRNSRGILYDLTINNPKDLETIKKPYPFFKSLEKIGNEAQDDYSFYEKIKYDLLGEKIYVRSATGKVYSLPVGSTILDYAYYYCEHRAPYISQGKINGAPANINTVLKNQDIVDFASDINFSISDKTQIAAATTNKARRLILERMNNNG